jgi:hypothetical protein
MIFTTQEISALKSLIEFHDDWEEVGEIFGVSIEQLYDKVNALAEQND